MTRTADTRTFASFDDKTARIVVATPYGAFSMAKWMADVVHSTTRKHEALEFNATISGPCVAGGWRQRVRNRQEYAVGYTVAPSWMVL